MIFDYGQKERDNQPKDGTHSKPKAAAGCSDRWVTLGL